MNEDYCKSQDGSKQFDNAIQYVARFNAALRPILSGSRHLVSE